MKNKMTAMLIATTLGMTAAQVHAQEVRNGGDPNELAEFTGLNGERLESWYAIKKDLLKGLMLNRHLEIDLGEISPEKLKIELTEALKTKVEFDNSAILVDGVSRPCENIVKTNGEKRIHCNIQAYASAMMNYTSETQYKMVAHEYLGIAGFEPNRYELSDYPLSSQISNSLRSVEVKKWGVVNKQETKTAGSTVLRCEGAMQVRRSSNSLKRNKDAIILFLPNGTAYVTSVIKDRGVAQIYVDEKGREHYEGMNKLTRFSIDRNPKAKVEKFNVDLNHKSGTTLGNGVILHYGYDMRILDKNYYVKFERTSLDAAVVMKDRWSRMPVASLSCETIHIKDASLNKIDDYLNHLSTLGWKTVDGESSSADGAGTDSYEIAPRTLGYDW